MRPGAPPSVRHRSLSEYIYAPHRLKQALLRAGPLSPGGERPKAFVAAFALAWIWRRSGSGGAGWLRKLGLALFPAFAVVAAAGLFTCYQNLRVTGSPWRIPYQEYQRQHGVPQPLVLSPGLIVQLSRHAEIRDDQETQLRLHNRVRMPLGFARKTAGSLRTIWRVCVGFLLLLPVLWTWPLRRSPAFLTAASALLLRFASHCLYGFYYGQYDAPVAAAWMLLIVLGWQRMREWRWRGRPTRLALSRTLAVAVVLSPCPLYFARAAEPIWPALHGWNDGFERECRDHDRRGEVLACFERQRSPQLLIVHYREPGHYTVYEWVYNSADLNSQHVLWARDMGPSENRALMAYYSDRTAWLIEPDEHPVRITPLSGQAALSCAVVR